jgi:hypothetical protein
VAPSAARPGDHAPVPWRAAATVVRGDGTYGSPACSGLPPECQRAPCLENRA